MGSLVENLSNFPWRNFNVSYAILFGSAVEGGGHDIDIAVKFNRYSFESYLDLLEGLSKHLSLREDHIDLIALNEEVPCHILVEIFSNGQIVYLGDPEELTADIRKRLNPCYDFLISMRKVGYLEKMLEAVKRGWRRRETRPANFQSSTYQRWEREE
jgi:predicted nucleotidyltransferase